MAFTDTLKAALEKKRAAQHPDVKSDSEQKNKNPASPAVANKPQKKASGRGR